jgi:predicted peptidase
MMKTTRWMGMATVALLCALAGAAAPGEGANGMAEEFSSKTISVGGKDSKYAVFVPKDYSADKPWPLIVFLHGAGERGDDGVAQTQAGIGPAIVKNPERFPAIVLLPQCPKETEWSSQIDALEAQMEATRGEYNIDPKRIYLTGLSMGGYGTWLWGAVKTDTFAALMPICGGGDPADIQALLKVTGSNPYGSHASRVRALAKVPIWAFHGGSDSVVPPERSRTMVEAVKAAGGNIVYTEFEGVDHNSWDPAYQSEDTIVWLLKQKK